MLSRDRRGIGATKSLSMFLSWLMVGSVGASTSLAAQELMEARLADDFELIDWATLRADPSARNLQTIQLVGHCVLSEGGYWLTETGDADSLEEGDAVALEGALTPCEPGAQCRAIGLFLVRGDYLGDIRLASRGRIKSTSEGPVEPCLP